MIIDASKTPTTINGLSRQYDFLRNRRGCGSQQTSLWFPRRRSVCSSFFLVLSHDRRRLLPLGVTSHPCPSSKPRGTLKHTCSGLSWPQRLELSIFLDACNRHWCFHEICVCSQYCDGPSTVHDQCLKSFGVTLRSDGAIRRVAERIESCFRR
jgi:hypothetical protein